MIIKRWNGSFSATRTFTLTSGSATINTGDTSSLTATMTISGTGIPAGTTISSITNSTTLVMSANATANGAQSLTFGGGFVNEFPRTKAQLIRNNSDTANIFDSNDKILPSYLPNSVFDNLLFYGTTSGNVGSAPSRLTLSAALIAAKNAADTANRSIVGYYFVINTAGTITGLTAIQDTITSQEYATLQFRPQDGGSSGTANTSSGSLEVGDWFVIESLTGAGTSGVPYVFTASVVNNSFETMTGADGTNAGAPGVVPAPAANQNLHFLRGDGTWVIPTNTTYSGSTSITLNGTSFERAALTGDVTASANANATTIAANAVTFAKFQQIATSTILGRNDAGTGNVEALTAAEVRTLLNVADGATANTGTVTSVSGAGTVDGLTLTGTVTSSGSLTLGGTLSTSAASITSGTLAVARGGTGQTSYANGELLIGNTTGGTLAKATLTQGTGITITNGAGSITVTNASPNATHTGDVTGSGALTIANNAVTFAKFQQIATSRIVGRITASTGNTEELTPANVRTIIELAAPIYIQTATPVPTVSNSLWYDIN
jgi:hypothetical protein